MKILFYFLFKSISIICLTLYAVNISDANQDTKKRILNSLFNSYDSRIRPNGHNYSGSQYPPCVDKINLYIRNIYKLDENAMELSSQLTFRQQWNDDRLRFDDHRGSMRYIEVRNSTNIWKPDVFFSNEKSAHFHDLLTPNILFRIHPNGDILYSTRVSLTTTCPMDLNNFPFAEQICEIKFASYGYTTDQLVLHWKDIDPIQVTKNIHVPHYRLDKYATSSCNARTNTGNYSCLKLELYFKPESGYYFTRFYIPCAMFVILSWLPLWLEPKNGVQTRLLLGVIVLVTATIIVAQINQYLPKVSYVLAVDVWTGSCLAFIFFALIQNFIIALLSGNTDCLVNRFFSNVTKNKRSGSKGSQHPNHVVMNPLLNSEHIEQMSEQKISNNATENRESFTLISLIDSISRLLFPVMFALFTIIYFLVY